MLTSEQINDLHRLYWSEHWPIRRIERANSRLALAEPDPFTLANLTTKSLTLLILGRLDPSTVTSLMRTLPQRRGFYRARQAGPAMVISNRNLRMSHAPVGQRSAHNPQCRQTSSSLTMMRPVFSELPI